MFAKKVVTLWLDKKLWYDNKTAWTEELQVLRAY